MSGVRHLNIDHHRKDLHQCVVGGRWTEFVTGDEFTSLVADTTPTVGINTNEQGGALQLYTDTTNENEVAVYGTHELFKFTAGQGCVFETKIKFTDLTNNGANVAFGFTDLNSLANLLGDAGAGPSASIGSGVMIYKVDGGAVWNCWMKNNGNTTSDVSVNVPGGSSYQEFMIDIQPVDGSVDQCVVTFHVDGQPLVDERNRPIQLKLAYASGTVMRPFLYGKTGTSGEALTIQCKYLFAAQAD